MKRLIVSILIASLAWSITSFADWKQDEKGWWYENADGSYKVNEWFENAQGYTYHFDTFGYMDTGLKCINNQWYNFLPTGELIYNWYDSANGCMSDDNGKAYFSSDPGFLGGQATTYATDYYDLIGLGIWNLRNVPITIAGYGELKGNGINETWIRVDSDTNKIGEPTVVQPGESETILFMAPDAHAINFPAGDYKFTAHYIVEGEPYYVWTDLKPTIDGFYFIHIDA